MRNKEILKKAVSVALGVLFLSDTLLINSSLASIWADRKSPVPTSRSASWATLPLNSDFKALPGHLGHVRKIRIAKKKQSPTVIHILDVHLNNEAQANISDAIASLQNQMDVDLMAVEGGFGTVDLKNFHVFHDQAAVQKGADLLLKDKVISGPLRTALMTGSKGLNLEGIDDADAYGRNVEAYRAAEPVQKQLKKKWAEKRNALIDSKRKVLNPALAAFDAEVDDYHAGGTPLKKFVARLLSFESSFALSGFDEAGKLENNLKLSLVEQERALLFHDLFSKLDEKEKEILLESAAEFRSGRITNTTFYSGAWHAAARAGLEMTRFPHFRTYVDYLVACDKIDTPVLFQEMRDVQMKIYSRLSVSEKERNLIRASHIHYLTGKLLDFTLSKEEWTEYKKMKFQIPNTKPQTNFNKENTKGLEFESSPFVWNLAIDDWDLHSFESFYELAEVRDHKMTENFLRIARGHTVSVLVTGGFHAEAIDRRLHEQGFTVVTFVPKFTPAAGESGSAYLSHFAQRKTPLEKIFNGNKLFLAPAIWTPEIRAVIATAVAGFAAKDPTQLANELTALFKETDLQVLRVWKFLGQLYVEIKFPDERISLLKIEEDDGGIKISKANQIDLARILAEASSMLAGDPTPVSPSHNARIPPPEQIERLATSLAPPHDANIGLSLLLARNFHGDLALLTAANRSTFNRILGRQAITEETTQEQYDELLSQIHPYYLVASRHIDDYIQFFEEHDGALFVVLHLLRLNIINRNCLVVNHDPHYDIRNMINMHKEPPLHLPISPSTWAGFMLERGMGRYLQVKRDKDGHERFFYATEENFHTKNINELEIPRAEAIRLIREAEQVVSTFDLDDLSLKEHPEEWHYSPGHGMEERIAATMTLYREAGKTPVRWIVSNAPKYINHSQGADHTWVHNAGKEIAAQAISLTETSDHPNAVGENISTADILVFLRKARDQKRWLEFDLSKMKEATDNFRLQEILTVALDHLRATSPACLAAVETPNLVFSFVLPEAGSDPLQSSVWLVKESGRYLLGSGGLKEEFPQKIIFLPYGLLLQLLEITLKHADESIRQRARQLMADIVAHEAHHARESITGEKKWAEWVEHNRESASIMRRVRDFLAEKLIGGPARKPAAAPATAEDFLKAFQEKISKKEEVAPFQDIQNTLELFRSDLSDENRTLAYNALKALALSKHETNGFNGFHLLNLIHVIEDLSEQEETDQTILKIQNLREIFSLAINNPLILEKILRKQLEIVIKGLPNHRIRKMNAQIINALLSNEIDGPFSGGVILELFDTLRVNRQWTDDIGEIMDYEQIIANVHKLIVESEKVQHRISPIEIDGLIDRIHAPFLEETASLVPGGERHPNLTHYYSFAILMKLAENSPSYELRHQHRMFTLLADYPIRDQKPTDQNTREVALQIINKYFERPLSLPEMMRIISLQLSHFQHVLFHLRLGQHSHNVNAYLAQIVTPIGAFFRAVTKHMLEEDEWLVERISQANFQLIEDLREIRIQDFNQIRTAKEKESVLARIQNLKISVQQKKDEQIRTKTAGRILAQEYDVIIYDGETETRLSAIENELAKLEDQIKSAEELLRDKDALIAEAREKIHALNETRNQNATILRDYLASRQLPFELTWDPDDLFATINLVEKKTDGPGPGNSEEAHAIGRNVTDADIRSVLTQARDKGRLVAATIDENKILIAACDYLRRNSMAGALALVTNPDVLFSFVMPEAGRDDSPWLLKQGNKLLLGAGGLTEGFSARQAFLPYAMLAQLLKIAENHLSPAMRQKALEIMTNIVVHEAAHVKETTTGQRQWNKKAHDEESEDILRQVEEILGPVELNDLNTLDGNRRFAAAEILVSQWSRPARPEKTFRRLHRNQRAFRQAA